MAPVRETSTFWQKEGFSTAVVVISGLREPTERACVAPPDDGKAKKIRTESRRMNCGCFLVIRICYMRLKGGRDSTDANFPIQTYAGRNQKRPAVQVAGCFVMCIVTGMQKLCRRPLVKPEGEAKQRQRSYRAAALKGSHVSFSSGRCARLVFG